jgi:hypothetical protein
MTASSFRDSRVWPAAPRRIWLPFSWRAHPMAAKKKQEMRPQRACIGSRPLDVTHGCWDPLVLEPSASPMEDQKPKLPSEPADDPHTLQLGIIFPTAFEWVCGYPHIPLDRLSPVGGLFSFGRRPGVKLAQPRGGWQRSGTCRYHRLAPRKE